MGLPSLTEGIRTGQDTVAPATARKERALIAAAAAVAGGLLTAYATELNQRVKERDDAYRELILLSSDRLHHWLVTVYAPLEYELKRTYAHDVRYLNPVTEEARNVRIKFSRVLREDLIDQLRPEVEALRNPVKHARGIRIS